MWCLLPEKADDFIAKLKDGTIDPEKLSVMTSDERNKFLGGIVGEDNAAKVNSMFEEKLLLKNVEQGIVSWAEKVSGLTMERKQALLDKIKLQKEAKFERIFNPEEGEDFLHDLASSKVGVDVTEKETKTIFDMTKQIEKYQSVVDSGKASMEYGVSKRLLEKYTGELKSAAKKEKWTAYLNPLKLIGDLSGLGKASKAAYDNSFIGRQGIKVLWNKPKIWAENSVKSFATIGRTLKGAKMKQGVMWDETDAILADIYSRKNFNDPKVNKVYKYLDLGNLEEAYPTTLPEKVPGLGRLFKASEQAYTGTAYRMRADLADWYIKHATKMGKDLTDDIQAKDLSRFINSMTGRGSIGAAEAIAKPLNVGFFSIKFLKSNLDFLTMHAFDKNITPYVRKEAAKNLARAVAGTTLTLVLADQLHPGSVEWDPRSTNFGKIKIRNTRFDVTGGMASMVTLASRVATKSKKTSTGEIKKLNIKGYKEDTVLDVVYDYFEGKASPAFSSLIAIWGKGETYEGEKPTVINQLLGLFEPLPVANYRELKEDPESANDLLSVILEGLGISTNTYGQGEFKKMDIKSMLKEDQSRASEIIGLPTKINADFKPLIEKMVKEDASVSMPGSATKIKPDENKDSREMTDKELQIYQKIYQKNLKDNLLKNKDSILKLTGKDFEKKLDEIKSDTTDKSKLKLIKGMLK